MAWYSWFSTIYDQALEDLYAPHRVRAFAEVNPGHRKVLLLPCGTGQDLAPLLPRLAPDPDLLCIDLDPGMLAKARSRGSRGCRFVQAPASELSSHVEPASLDLVVFSLGLSVVPEHESVLRSALSRLRPGGQCLIFDCWAERRNLNTWPVEWMAQADLSRTPFRILEAECSDYRFTPLPDAKPLQFGGTLYVATGTRRAQSKTP
jgi:ubiquinone/menaquinone biosynthesis C-methylase UbiE